MYINASTKSGDSWAKAKVVSETDDIVELCLNGRNHHAFIHKEALVDYEMCLAEPHLKPHNITIIYQLSGIIFEQICPSTNMYQLCDELEDCGATIIEVKR
jgi:hypothetical protein